MAFLYLLVLFAIIGLLALPYEKIIIKRIIITKKIRKICNSNDIKFKVINRFYPFSKNTRDKFDFLMRIGNTVYPIKLYSARNPSATLVIDPSGDAIVREKVREPLSRDGKRSNKILERKIIVPKMKIKSNTISKRFECVPIYLNEPSYSTVLISDGQGSYESSSKRNIRICGCYWMDKFEFAYMVKNRMK